MHQPTLIAALVFHRRWRDKIAGFHSCRNTKSPHRRENAEKCPAVVGQRPMFNFFARRHLRVSPARPKKYLLVSFQSVSKFETGWKEKDLLS
jgi:hypothetical protein